ncbi:type IV pilus secretin PilQ [Dokdonella sp.]|uniref:type IV pilus secretin PilQ n=1 Tax=Dokdonella sp. TaxID=2291710 RepID=UPI0031C0CA7D|nr:type IV pilus secretin PilQ [Dokdonella sp.]
MTTTIVATCGRRLAVPVTGMRSCLLWALVLLGGLLGPQAHAENALNDISYSALPGGKVEVTLKFAQPASPPQAFSTEAPPSIALDFADTRNAVARRHIDVGAGATSGISAIEAAGRTRVVVDLFRPTTYDTRVSGNTVVVTINSASASTSGVAAAAAQADPTKAVRSAGRVAVSNVDFRRGKDGQGRVVVAFDGPGAAVNMKREGGNIILDMPGVGLAAGQGQRLDVLDFATPVQSIETQARGNGVRMVITAKPPFEPLAYQTGDQYVLEVAPKKDEPQLGGKNAEPVYSGSRVTFNFQDIPTRSVLQLIADVSDLNIVVADSVQGNVTLRLVNVPWDQALDIVLQAKGLDQRTRGNVIWVAPQAEIASREQALADARMKMEDTEPLISDFIPISYGTAKDIAALLTTEIQANQAGGQQSGGAQARRGFLSPRGSVTYDDRTNTLLVSDIPSKVQEIRQLVAVLDKPVQQVLIESRIVIATDSFARELGVKFGISGGYEDSHGNVVSTSGNLNATDTMSNVAMNNRMNTPGRGMPNTAPGAVPGGIAVPLLGDRLNVNMPVTSPAGSFGIAILGADYLLDLELSAAQTEGRSETVSSPRVITANQKEAHITQGQEIGYSTIQATQGGSQPTVQFKDATLELKVTPTITADDRVVLNLEVKKDTLAGYYSGPTGDIPLIDKRQVASQVLVDNGQTVVLGGVYEVTKSDLTRKVPFLGDLPVLGNLFKNKARNDTKAELLIFVTPRILSESQR